MCTSCPPVQVLCTNTPPSYLLLLFQPELFITIHHPLCTITCYKTCAHHIHQVMCTNTPSSYLLLPLQPEPFITGARWPPPPPPARTILQNGIKAACTAALLSQLKTSHWADNHMICTQQQLFSNPNLFISFHWWPWSLSQNLARHADDCAQVKVGQSWPVISHVNAGIGNVCFNLHSVKCCLLRNTLLCIALQHVTWQWLNW